MKAKDFLRYVIDPTLIELAHYEPRMNSNPARALLLATAQVESDLVYLQQHGGPAVGLFQMEPATHASLWDNWLAYRPDAAALFRSLSVTAAPNGRPRADEMRYNLVYSAAMARLRYWRVRYPLPPLHAAGLCRYHELHYNTPEGAVGRTPELEGLERFNHAVYLVEAVPQESTVGDGQAGILGGRRARLS